MLANLLQEQVGDFFQVGGREVDIVLRTDALLDGAEMLIEVLIRDTQGNLAEKLNEATIGIPGKTLVARLRRQSVQGRLIEPQVENGVHHAGHRHGRARAHRHQQRVGFRSESLAGRPFKLRHVLPDVIHQSRRQALVAVGEVAEASFCSNDKPWRHIEPDLCHLAQVRTLAP